MGWRVERRVSMVRGRSVFYRLREKLGEWEVDLVRDQKAPIMGELFSPKTSKR